MLTEGLERLGDALPLTHTVALLQDPWLGFGWNASATYTVGGILLAAATLGVRLFRWE